jgi:hypothetical protein
MMTLDEAILHAEEIAEEFNQGVKQEEWCMKCAEEHKQLAEWLKELKALREFNKSTVFFKMKGDTPIEIAQSIIEHEENRYYSEDRDYKVSNLVLKEIAEIILVHCNKVDKELEITSE